MKALELTPAAAPVASVVARMSDATRFNILQHISMERPGFAEARKLGALWDALIGEWDFQAMLEFAPADASPPGLPRRRVVETMDLRAERDYRLSAGAAVTLRELIKTQLETPAPQRGEPDTRWNGTIAMPMRRLFDLLDQALGGDS